MKGCTEKHSHADLEAIKEQGKGVRRTGKVARKLLQNIVNHKTSAEAMVTARKTGLGPIDRVMIEFCCAQDSALGKPTANSKGCKLYAFMNTSMLTPKHVRTWLWGS